MKLKLERLEKEAARMTPAERQDLISLVEDGDGYKYVPFSKSTRIPATEFCIIGIDNNPDVIRITAAEAAELEAAGKVSPFRIVGVSADDEKKKSCPAAPCINSEPGKGY